MTEIELKYDPRRISGPYRLPEACVSRRGVIETA